MFSPVVMILDLMMWWMFESIALGIRFVVWVIPTAFRLAFYLVRAVVFLLNGIVWAVWWAYRKNEARRQNSVRIELEFPPPRRQPEPVNS